VVHGEQPRILIVRLSAIGDIVVTTTLFHGLRERWPKAHIGWLVESRMASLLRGHPGLHPGIDRLHEWKRTEWSADARRGRIDRALSGALALRRELRAENYDLALDAQGLLKSSLLAALSGARERWVLRPREGAKFVAHHAVARRDRVLPGDEYRDLLRALEVTDAAASARMRLNIPAGTAVRFEPGETKTVTLVAIAGRRVVRGGNNVCNGPVAAADDTQTRAAVAARLTDGNFLGSAPAEPPSKRQKAASGSASDPSYAGLDVPRDLYARMYGPTTGDVVRLADSELYIRVERDMTVYGDECKFGGGKVPPDR